MHNGIQILRVLQLSVLTLPAQALSGLYLNHLVHSEGFVQVIHCTSVRFTQTYMHVVTP